jgi:gliding motility-associated-like protein
VNNNTSNNLSYIPTVSGSETVYLTVTDGVTTTTGQVIVTVYPVPTVTITPNLQTYVIGTKERTLTANVVGGSSPISYSWSVNDAGLLSSKTNQTTGFSAIIAGNYIVTVTVSDGHCGDTATVSPSVIDEPNWVAVCSGGSYIFSLDAPHDLKWVFTGAKNMTFTGVKAQIPFDTTGVVHISLFDLNDNTVIYSNTIMVNTKPYVAFVYTPDTGISIGDEVSFENLSILDVNKKVIPNNMTFFWDFVGDQVYTSTLVNPTDKYDEIGNYYVNLIGMDTITHCRDTATKKLEVRPNPKCGLEFPNAFTPDAIKDNHFLPGYIVGIKDSGYDLQLFNRWGQLLFETNSKSGKWDGTFNGAACKQDVYVYHCKAVCENGKDIFINGDVTLIK